MSSPRMVRPILRRSKTINVSECMTKEDNGVQEHEVKFEEPGWDGPAPTSSCQALRHAVSALTRIDDFCLEELGSGFFANVYKATHRASGEDMVMKINKDSCNRHNALREVQLMNRLSHPNILRLLGVCVHEGQLHGLTEYIPGGSLDRLLQDPQEELPWCLRIQLALGVARGVRYLHIEGVFHRDLTSKNVLIKKGENKNYSAIIADFGLATKIPDPESGEVLQPVGCPWWMAPEIIRGQFYDHRADMFSFGIISCEMTARVDADPETLPRTQNFGVDYLSFCQLFDYCPLDFLQLTFKCCQVLPEKRPDFSTVISTLEQIYTNLRLQPSAGTLHKRSRSEDNIISTCDTDLDPLTPQAMAAAMCRADPLWSPAPGNPFAQLARFRHGRKLLDTPRSRTSSGGSSLLSSSLRSCDLSLTLGGGASGAGSQSLPSSPVMLRRAAQRHHQESLHGKEIVQLDGGLNAVLTVPGQQAPGGDTAASDRRASFGCSRTRSLGALDAMSPGPQRRGNSQHRRTPMDKGFSNIKEASFEDGLDSDDPFCYPQHNLDPNINPEVDQNLNPDPCRNSDPFCDPPDFFEYDVHPLLMELSTDAQGPGLTYNLDQQLDQSHCLDQQTYGLDHIHSLDQQTRTLDQVPSLNQQTYSLDRLNQQTYSLDRLNQQTYSLDQINSLDQQTSSLDQVPSLNQQTYSLDQIHSLDQQTHSVDQIQPLDQIHGLVQQTHSLDQVHSLEQICNMDQAHSLDKTYSLDHTLNVDQTYSLDRVHSLDQTYSLDQAHIDQTIRLDSTHSLDQTHSLDHTYNLDQKSKGDEFCNGTPAHKTSSCPVINLKEESGDYGNISECCQEGLDDTLVANDEQKAEAGAQQCT